jgi:hypothetical protein
VWTTNGRHASERAFAKTSIKTLGSRRFAFGRKTVSAKKARLVGLLPPTIANISRTESPSKAWTTTPLRRRQRQLVDMNPDQVDAALFALESPIARGLIVADEVG